MFPNKRCGWFEAGPASMQNPQCCWRWRFLGDLYHITSRQHENTKTKLFVHTDMLMQMNPEKVKVRGFNVFQPKLGHIINLHKHIQSGCPYNFPAIHSGQWFHDAFTPSSPIWLWSRMSSAIVWLIRRAWAKAWKKQQEAQKAKQYRPRCSTTRG